MDGWILIMEYEIDKILTILGASDMANLPRHLKVMRQNLARHLILVTCQILTRYQIGKS
jgi:hypothetical protein